MTTTELERPRVAFAPLDRRYQRELARRRRRARIRRNRLIAALLLVAISTGAYFAISRAGASATPAANAPRPHLVLTSLLAPLRTVPGTLSPFSWPATGEAAVAVLGAGLVSSSPSEAPVPIASLTKMMTAYLVLQAHPLRPGEQGPMFTMDAHDVAMYVHADETDESNVAIKTGERLSEYQLLEALLLPSADNIADRLAQWVSGSIPAFVQKMNAEAAILHLSGTHYADASGVDPASRSTARDQALLASMLMENPVVRSIVDRPEVAFPVAGTIWNVNPALGVDGIVGIKSGYTSEASGCLATAAYRRIKTKSVLVISVTLGQPDGLYQAATTDEGLLAHAEGQLVLVHPSGLDGTVGKVAIAPPTRGSTRKKVHLVAAAPSFIGWPGLRYRTELMATPKATTVPRSGVVGDLDILTAYGDLASAPVGTKTSSSSEG